MESKTKIPENAIPMKHDFPPNTKVFLHFTDNPTGKVAYAVWKKYEKLHSELVSGRYLMPGMLLTIILPDSQVITIGSNDREILEKIFDQLTEIKQVLIDIEGAKQCQK